jgi:DNA-directed RNA polymerase specialized sigma subunit
LQQIGATMLEIKRILRMMNSEMLHKIIKIAELDEKERQLIREFFILKNTRDNICEKMSISRSTFTNIKNQALLKIKLTLTILLDEKIKQMT